MDGINDRVIDDALEAMTHVMAQANKALQANQNPNEGAGEFHGLGKYQNNNLPTFKGRYDPEGAHTWVQEIEKIFRVMACTNAQKVLFGPHMLSKEAKYWWENTHQRMEYVGTTISWNNFKNEFLDKYFPDDVRNGKEIEFLELK
ncbi:uncharacterized protein LOC127130378 [Lathyrus oleraceus]|uniref:uncharacterized protein LOC127130378 n=1 Tax=Pisum sativum TaxID=3888 RepID=UPI0021CE74A6|nr:uncharacterized protein LOC127130378 [Pisum sativum]